MPSNKMLIRCAGVLVALLCGGLVMAQALGQSDAGGAAGGPPVPATAPIAVPAGLNDMLQPVDAQPAAAALRRPTPSSDELNAEPGPRVSLPDRLRLWPDSTRREAQLRLELPRSAPDAVAALACEVEAAWSTGQHETAIALLQRLEAYGTPVAVGVAWSTPQAVGGEARGFADVRIGTQTGGTLTKLDYDQTSGALYAVVRWTSDNGWALHRSTDDGRTWHETYFWYAGAGEQAVDVDMAVVGAYVYVGYVPSDFADEARLRRSFANTGLSDGLYGFQVVLDGAPNTITEVALESNADSFQNRIYYAVRQSNNIVRWAWDVSTDGLTFTEDSPAGTSAQGGLDMHWNADFTSWYLFLSYVGTDDAIHVLRYNSALWGSIVVDATFTGSHDRTAVSADANTVICAYEVLYPNGQGIMYRISYDAGDSWNYGDLADPAVGEGGYQMADITARGGAGTAVVYTHEVGEPDDVLIRYRRGYAPGVWQAPLRINNLDVTTGSWTALNWTPRDTSDSFELSYGLVYFSGSLPYFNRLQVVRGDMNCDGTYGYLSFGDINPFVQYLSNHAAWQAAYPDCPPENGDINGDGTFGHLSFGDINPFVALLSTP